jgi:ubiquinone/menaquinone biosynthesis C-methylase UbiE
VTDFTELKQKHRKTWAAGDYDQIARGILAVADHVVRVARIRAGERVLDVACGTGNTALAAKARGAEVTALDLTPELLAVAREREVGEGLSGVDWREGDTEDMPFEDASFDVVVSSCGLMFAPDQQRVADEVARVTRPGGRIAIQAWTQEGGVGRMFRVVGKHVPPPAGVPSPFEWGDEEKVKELFGAWFTDYRFERYDCPEYTDTAEELAELFIGRYGPTNRAYHALSEKNKDEAEAFRTDLTKLYRGYITPEDGTVRWGREYLITLATRA